MIELILNVVAWAGASCIAIVLFLCAMFAMDIERDDHNVKQVILYGMRNVLIILAGVAVLGAFIQGSLWCIDTALATIGI